MFLLKRLENPKIPLLGPNVWSLKFWGLLLPENIYKKYCYLFLHTLVTSVIVTEFVDIWFIKDDINLLLNNLKVTMLSIMSVVKVLTFLYWQENWRNIIDYVTRADLAQRDTDDVTKNDLLKKFTRYCRKITYLYWFLMAITVAIMILQPVFKFALSQSYRENVKNGTDNYLPVFSSWVPFDKNTIPGYLVASSFQSYGVLYGWGWIVSFDTNAMVTMVFFKAELELLKIDCANIFGTERNPVSDDVALQRMIKCHRRQIELVKYSRIFDSCLSTIMLLYMFVCSVMLCVTGYQLTSDISAVERFLIAEFLIFGVSQLFIYCWHSNEVYYASLSLSEGPYESTWWCRHVSHRKNLMILTTQFSQEVVFSAGPFTNLSVATFISILKGAYSYYTLLCQSQTK